MILLTYLLGGVFGGALFGTVMPVIGKRGGGALTGFVVMIPVFTALRFTSDGFGLGLTMDSVDVVALALILGAPLGAIYKSMFLGDR